MGRERTWKRKHLLLYLACCVSVLLSVLFGFWGCSHLARGWQAEGRLARATTLLAAGEYRASLRETNAVLKLCPLTLCDEALFQMGLVYAYPRNPERDYQRSAEFFQRVIEEFPQSRVKKQAAVWVLFVQEMMDNERAIAGLNKKNGHLRKAVEKEKQKVKEFENQAEKLQAKVDKLKDRLLRLKEIDLRIEQKKSRVKQ